MDILAKLLHEIGIRYNCNYARERLEGGEPRKPQLRVAAASGMLFACKVGYISSARMGILQSVFGSSYEQQETNDILYGLKLLVRNEAPISKQAVQNVPPKRTPVNIPPVKLGETVIHRSFGSGIIINIQANSYLEIDFSGTIRKFQHPQAFVAGFLKKQE